MASNFYDVTSSNQNTTFEAPGMIFVQIGLILLLKSLFSLISCQLQLIANCRRAKGHIVPQGVLLSMMHGILHTYSTYLVPKVVRVLVFSDDFNLPGR